MISIWYWTSRLNFVCLVVFLWINYDCFVESMIQSPQIVQKSTSVVSRTVFGKKCYFKRDDLANFHGINGNKYRKLYFLLEKSPQVSHVISFGGIQSNAMLALANSIATLPSNVKWTYITKKIPAFAKSLSFGNLATALNLGMQVSALLMFVKLQLMQYT